MSILSAVYVPDGIALSGDSRVVTKYTNKDGERISDILSDTAEKIFLLKGTIGIACGGTLYSNGKLIGTLIKEFEDTIEDDNIEEIAIKLKDYTINNFSNDVTYFVAGYKEKEPYCYRIVGERVTRLNKDNKIIYGASWFGEPEALSKLVIGNPKMNIMCELMSLRDACDLSEYFVDVTIKYQKFNLGQATCGGPIDTLIITKDYSKFIKHKLL